MLLSVEHRFSFEYDGYISESFLELRVQPKATPRQTVASFGLAIGPPTRVFRYLDWNENVTHHFTITKFHDRIAVAAQSIVDTRATAPTIAAVTDAVGSPDLPYPLLDFLELAGPVRLTPALRAAHRAMAPTRSASLGEHVLALGAAIVQRFEYQKNVTQYDSTTEDFLKIGAGVCQDFAHLMLGLLRLSGIPCRYVSGYLHIERKKREPSQSHAWVEVYAPSSGWVGFDPTHNRAIDERYVIVGHGRHYDDVPPNKGTYPGTPREMLRAEVHTQLTTAKAIPRLTDEVRPIEVQTFVAAPQRSPDVLMSGSADEQSQQQQQQ
jgi:transglutaminase-like putative cysteine protease